LSRWNAATSTHYYSTRRGMFTALVKVWRANLAPKTKSYSSLTRRRSSSKESLSAICPWQE
jgi:hypothetical protein